MPSRNIVRGASIQGYATAVNAPVYVDSDDNRLKMIPAGSGTAEVVLQEATGKSLTPTAAVALTAAQSGMEIFLNASAGFAITLPAPAAGLKYRFTVGAAFASTNFTIVTASSANIIFGAAVVAGETVAASEEDTISFVATAELPGDWVEVWSDGTNWYVSGHGVTSGSITFTQAS